MTYTYAIMLVSEATYQEVRAALIEADYHQAIHHKDGRECLDMRGIALQVAPTATPTEAQTLRQMTLAMREADQHFERVGGGTRHYLRDCLFPVLAKHGIGLHFVPTAAQTERITSADEVEEE